MGIKGTLRPDDGGNQLKKIAMLLTLVLCLMAAGTAMAAVQFVDCTPEESFFASATAKNVTITVKSSLPNKKPYMTREDESSSILDITGEYRLNFSPAVDYDVFEDEIANQTPTSTYGVERILSEIKEAMKAEMSGYFNDGDIVNYMFLDAEGEAMTIYESQAQGWNKMNVPEQGEGVDQKIWAASVAGIVDYSHFGHAVKKMQVLYSTYTITTTNKSNDTLNLIIDKVPIQMTDDGVQMTFNHLSPVMIAWTEAPVSAPLDVPETGDSSSLPGLFLLLGMSVAAMGAMKLRRREN